MTIDYVFPYVDSSDPVWQQTYEKYCQDHDIKPTLLGNEKERFRDWGNLIRFVFRSIATNMPWINNIFFLVQSESQVPDWLDKSKVKVVCHRDFIPPRYLPTYNSTTIEMFLWNIPDLGDYFIYGNDDLFALAACDKDDFYSPSGAPKIHLTLKDRVNINAFRQTLIRGQDMINKDFPKVIIPKDKYYRTNHLMSPMTMETVKQVWMKHRIEICNGISAFRTTTNVNQYIYTLYQVFSNQYQDVKFPGKYLDFASNTVDSISKVIKEHKYKVICINDSGLNNEKDSVTIYNALLSVFPNKCKYELASAKNIKKTVFDPSKELAKKDFEAVPSTVLKLQNPTENWSVLYIKEHKFPWVVSIKTLDYSECFTSTSEIKSAISEQVKIWSDIVNTANSILENTALAPLQKFELQYDNFSISKTDDGYMYVTRNKKQYRLEDVMTSKEILLFIESKLATVSI